MSRGERCCSRPVAPFSRSGPPMSKKTAKRSETKRVPPAKAAAAAPKKSAHAAPASSKSAKSEGTKGAKGAATPTAGADQPKRKLGLRGAAPWAARHAAKHAAEARARAAVPPPPGSARATIRVPSGAEEIKAKIGELHNCLVQIRGLRKNLAKSFFEVGTVLRDVQNRRLYEAKGYGSFEAFLEREMAELGKTTALRLIRVAATFQREAALELGMDKVMSAMSAIEAASETPIRPNVPGSVPSVPSVPPSVPRLPLPLKPPLGRVG